MTILLTLILAGLVTWGLRTALVLVGDRPGLTELVSTRAALIPPAVLAAIVTGALAIDGGRVAVPVPIEVLAVGAGMVAVRRFGNVGAAIGVGLPVYWIGMALGLA